MSKPESKSKPEVVYIYTGRRFGANRKDVYQRFETADGQSSFFKGISRVWIGYSYEGKKASISKSPSRVLDAERVDNPSWELEDAVVEQALRRRRAETKVSREQKPIINAAIRAIMPLFAAESDIFHLNAVIKYLVSEAYEELARQRKNKK